MRYKKRREPTQEQLDEINRAYVALVDATVDHVAPVIEKELEFVTQKLDAPMRVIPVLIQKLGPIAVNKYLAVRKSMIEKRMETRKKELELEIGILGEMA